MKCELCNSDEIEPRKRLCLPCVEAVARLCVIANTATAPIACESVKAEAAVSTKRAPIVAARPYAGLLI